MYSGTWGQRIVELLRRMREKIVPRTVADGDARVSLGRSETDLVGQWIRQGDRVGVDPVEGRINELIARHLQRLAYSSAGWTILYRDPQDGRYWELSFPHGEMPGGGSKRLTNLSEEAAATKCLGDGGTFTETRREGFVERLKDWPAPGFEDTEIGVFMEPEVDHGETKIYAGVQA